MECSSTLLLSAPRSAIRSSKVPPLLKKISSKPKFTMQLQNILPVMALLATLVAGAPSSPAKRSDADAATRYVVDKRSDADAATRYVVDKRSDADAATRYVVD
ncbi:hypothetical protein I7I50_01924 [Histoplasma capsulatum G186AR]|uniref:Uncharacterized protein n=1 Tax=Ajellomyces capsulatus TaxID=5037 RepID=A0A8H7YBY6_AJECA|nr:hypothetical protein I7I52_12138 [Histoplasma capsulatum]QSS71182.1 hypothetical protein I7I50_01924 [Histoplasma capsulatum G186AR]